MDAVEQIHPEQKASPVLSFHAEKGGVAVGFPYVEAKESWLPKGLGKSFGQ